MLIIDFLFCIHPIKHKTEQCISLAGFLQVNHSLALLAKSSFLVSQPIVTEIDSFFSDVDTTSLGIIALYSQLYRVDGEGDTKFKQGPILFFYVVLVLSLVLL